MKHYIISYLFKNKGQGTGGTELFIKHKITAQNIILIKEGLKEKNNLSDLIISNIIYVGRI